MKPSVNTPPRAQDRPRISRKDRAKATRRKILAGAETEFLAKGFQAATMADIAERAGVSVQMLYFSFGTKAKLMGAIVENAVLGAESPVEPMKSDWYEHVKEATTAADTIRRFIIGSGPVFQRASPIALVGDAGATTDPELAAITRHGDELRASNFTSVVELAATKGPLKSGNDIQTAADILVAVFSPALYMEFIADRKWSHAQTLDWLAVNVPSLICADWQPQIPPGASTSDTQN